jgi:DNA-binding transcriptional MerR regulator
MEYTIKKVAKMCGVTVRTLHYYDEIGLFGPSLVRKNGYRAYKEKDLSKLQQILFFKELDFSLGKIKEIISSEVYNPLVVFEDQKNLLIVKRDRLNELIKTIETTAISLKGGENMTNDDKFSVFNDPTYQKYKDESEKRWGNTNAYKESMKRVSKMSKEEWNKVKNESKYITLSISDLMKEGVNPKDDKVQKQIGRHYNHLRNFYEPNLEIFAGLAIMYVEDPRFKKTYEDISTGLAEYMHDAMLSYIDTQS